MAYLEKVQLLFSTYQVAGLSPVQGSKNSLRNSFPAANFSKVSFKDHMRLAESALPVTLSSSMNTEADSYRYWQDSGLGCLWPRKDINGLLTEGQGNRTARWGIRLGREVQSTEDTGQGSAHIHTEMEKTSSEYSTHIFGIQTQNIYDINRSVHWEVIKPNILIRNWRQPWYRELRIK